MQDKEVVSIFMYLEDAIYPDYNRDEENLVNIPYSWMRQVCSLSEIYVT